MRLFLFAPFHIRIVIFAETVVFLIAYRNLFIRQYHICKAILLVREMQVILHHFPQKLGSPGSVRQGVEHFKIDPVVIIGHFKQKRLLVSYIQAAAGLLVLFSNNRP